MISKNLRSGSRGEGIIHNNGPLQFLDRELGFLWLSSSDRLQLLRSGGGGETWSEVFGVPRESFYWGPLTLRAGPSGVVWATYDQCDGPFCYDDRDGAVLNISAEGDVLATGSIPLAPESISFASDDVIWLAGERHTIACTNTRGDFWVAQESGVFETLRITAMDHQHAWAVGGRGTIVATTDGRQTWSRRDSGTEMNLLAIAFVDQLLGWAVGEAGTIIKTADGGVTWTPEKSGGSYSPRHPNVSPRQRLHRRR